MKKFKKTSKSLKQGSTLLTVVGALTIMSIFVMATLTMVAQAKINTLSNFKSKQAYYNSQTALDTLINFLNDPANAAASMKILTEADTGVSSVVTFPDKSTCTLTIKKATQGSKPVIITATSTYLGESSSIAAYFKVGTGIKNQLFENSIEVNGGANVPGISILGDSMFYSDAAVDAAYKTLTLTNDTMAAGSFYNAGNTVIKTQVDLADGIGGVDIKGHTISITGNLKFDNGAKVLTTVQKTEDNSTSYVNVARTLQQESSTFYIGSKDAADKLFLIDIYCGEANLQQMIQYGNFMAYKREIRGTPDLTTGNVSIKNNAVTINGDMYVEGNLSLIDNGKLILNGNLHVKGDLVCGSGSELKITGTTTVGGSLSLANTNSGKYTFEKIAFIGGGLEDKTNSTNSLDNVFKKAVYVKGTSTLSVFSSADKIYTGSLDIKNLDRKDSFKVDYKDGANTTGTNIKQVNWLYPAEDNGDPFNEERLKFPTDTVLSGSSRLSLPEIEDPDVAFKYDIKPSDLIQTLKKEGNYPNSSLKFEDNTGFYSVSPVKGMGTTLNINQSGLLTKNFVQSNTWTNAEHVQINVTTKDVVIVISEDIWFGSKKIIVNNTSDVDSPKFCYIIVEKDKSINMDNGMLLERLTYDCLFGTGEQLDNGNTVPTSHNSNPSRVLNLKTKDASGNSLATLSYDPTSTMFTPNATRTFLILDEGVNMNLSNNCLVEGGIYGPNSKATVANGKSMNVTITGVESQKINGQNVVFIGAAIFGHANLQNKIATAYVKPNDSSPLNDNENKSFGDYTLEYYQKR